MCCNINDLCLHSLYIYATILVLVVTSDWFQILQSYMLLL